MTLALQRPLRLSPFPIIAELGNDRCAALGTIGRGEAPALDLCRKLIELGIPPTTPLHVYRGGVLCLVIRTIGEGAELTVGTNNQGTPVFRKLARKPAPGLAPGPSVAPNAPIQPGAPPDEIAAPTPLAMTGAMRSLVVYTRDERVPLDPEDPEMEHSWRCVPVPPTNDGGWIIVDDSKDYKTGWLRRCHLAPGGHA